MVDQKECSVAKKGWSGQQQIGKLMKRSGALKGVSGLADPPTLAFLCQLVLLVGTIHRVLSVFPHNVFGNPPTKYSLIGLGVYIEACRSNKPGPMMAIYFNLFF